MLCVCPSLIGEPDEAEGDISGDLHRKIGRNSTKNTILTNSKSTIYVLAGIVELSSIDDMIKTYLANTQRLMIYATA
jgi:hypothetical protein